MCGCCHHHPVNPSHPNSIPNPYPSLRDQGTHPLLWHPLGAPHIAHFAMCGCCHHHPVNPSHPNSIPNPYPSLRDQGTHPLLWHPPPAFHHLQLLPADCPSSTPPAVTISSSKSSNRPAA